MRYLLLLSIVCLTARQLSIVSAESDDFERDKGEVDHDKDLKSAARLMKRFIQADKAIGPGPPAVIRFIGMQHGYTNDSLARQALEKSLERTTKHVIRIDSFERSKPANSNSMDPASVDVTWHSEQISECSEKELADLLATIKSPTSGAYAREFKMDLGEDFNQPQQVELQWVGLCTNLVRKRDQMVGEPPNGSSSSAPVSGSLTTTRTSTSAPPPPTTTTEAIAPTTTLDPVDTATVQITTTAPSATATELDTLVPVAGSGADSSSTDESASIGTGTTTEWGFKLESMSDSFFTNSSSTQDPFSSSAAPPELSTVSANTTSSQPDVGDASDLLNKTSGPSEGVVSAVLDSATVAALPSSTTASEPAQPSTESPTTTTKTSTTTSSSTTAAAATETSTTSTSTTTVAPPVKTEPIIQLTTVEPSSLIPSSSAGELHYGKYVGLTSAFLICIAYVICARSYRRQGMYELHESTSSLAT